MGTERRRIIREELQRLVSEEVAEQVINKLMRDSEIQNYDMRHPYWREELREYIETHDFPPPSSIREVPLDRSDCIDLPQMDE